ncbi:cyclase [Cereibacter changlensis JA139]|uniref:Cyclase n=2 Tax=Cereibacter changlensis TaxID=402884 RepID=A0A2T4JXY9_9RHOB|nr:SRPBCC family protein [Cereibacter changlensis]PTE22736.1 cyclase [Cereibacter changlensis JA139]PZX51741.1 putative membrane protein [Cereibacter changlensis]
MTNREHMSGHDDRQALWLTLGIGVLAGVVGYSVFQATGRNHVAHRPEDDAPARSTRRGGPARAVTGRTVTIAKPRAELYAFWRDAANLPRFMSSVGSATTTGDVTQWQLKGPAGMPLTLETRIIEHRDGELLVWRSTPDSQIEAAGRVTFRDAPAGRGTEVEAQIAYVPPLGEAGRLVAKLFQSDPSIQGRRELKRFKMLMETGEIATSRNQKS